MNDLVINSLSIENYVSKMINLLSSYIEEIDMMLSFSNSLIWESSNRDAIIDSYEKKLKEYYIFAKNLYKIVKYLETYLDEYDECIEKLKIDFKKLDNKFGMGDK